MTTEHPAFADLLHIAAGYCSCNDTEQETITAGIGVNVRRAMDESPQARPDSVGVITKTARSHRTFGNHVAHVFLAEE